MHALCFFSCIQRQSALCTPEERLEISWMPSYIHAHIQSKGGLIRLKLATAGRVYLQSYSNLDPQTPLPKHHQNGLHIPLTRRQPFLLFSSHPAQLWGVCCCRAACLLSRPNIFASHGVHAAHEHPQPVHSASHEHYVWNQSLSLCIFVHTAA